MNRQSNPYARSHPNSPQMYPYPSRQNRPGNFSRNRSRRSMSRPTNNQPSFGNQTNIPPTQEKKGILSKIFRNKNTANNSTPQSLFSLPPNSSRGAASAASQAAASTASTGGFLQSLINPANLTGMLNNTQKVLQAAESITPLVQEYGPLVKNIPAMWKLYRGMKNIDDTSVTSDSENTSAQSQQQVQETNSANGEPKIFHPTENHAVVESRLQQAKMDNKSAAPVWAKGESKPKLFI